MANPFDDGPLICCSCPEPDDYDAETDDPLPSYIGLCGCPTVEIECVSTQKDAELCGHGEFEGDGQVASVPPKRYKRREYRYESTDDGPVFYARCQGDEVITEHGVLVDAGDYSYYSYYDDEGQCRNLVSYTTCSGYYVPADCLFQTITREITLVSKTGSIYTVNGDFDSVVTIDGDTCTSTVTPGENQGTISSPTGEYPSCSNGTSSSPLSLGAKTTETEGAYGWITDSPTSKHVYLVKTDTYSGSTNEINSKWYNTYQGNPCIEQTTLEVPSQTFVSRSIIGTDTLVESSEDTDDDALARAIPTTGTACTTIYELRTTLFSFTHRAVEYTATATNLVVGVEYTGCVRIQKREAYSGTEPDGADTETWIDVEPDTIEAFTATTTEETLAEDVELPIAQGWEYRIAGAYIWPTTADCDCPTTYVEPEEE